MMDEGQYMMHDGKCPVQDFLDSLPGKAAQKVVRVLSLLADFDDISSFYFKKLVGTEEIWECRIQFGSNSYRVLCSFADGSAGRDR
ncbi:MAG: type II toxin-antitoxin system RelE/ParE family toxin [Proteobacteria bacterium]|nr:type II toxin-antitoxin system RelE/ParE family toxin [Pseudomonadota bacterium]